MVAFGVCTVDVVVGIVVDVVVGIVVDVVVDIVVDVVVGMVVDVVVDIVVDVVVGMVVDMVVVDMVVVVGSACSTCEREDLMTVISVVTEPIDSMFDVTTICIGFQHIPEH